MLGSLFQVPTNSSSANDSLSASTDSNGGNIQHLSLNAAPLIAAPPDRPRTDDIMSLFNTNGGGAQQPSPKFGFGAAVPMVGGYAMGGAPIMTGGYMNGGAMSRMQHGTAGMCVVAES